MERAYPNMTMGITDMLLTALVVTAADTAANGSWIQSVSNGSAIRQSHRMSRM